MGKDGNETMMDLVVSFDTTGSMYPCLSQVRRNVEEFVNTMFDEFLDLRIGVIAHGDYCDKDNPYTIRYKELSRDSVGLCRFIRNVEQTYGGDSDECYELVLNLAGSSALGWRKEAEKIFIMIGDASPHAPSYPANKDNLDWRVETMRLADLGVKVFSVHALASMRSSSRAFYKHVAENTLGVYLTLEQFSEIVDLIKATVYQRSGEERLNEFITIIKDTGKLTRTMDNNIRRLKGEKVPDDIYSGYSCVHHGGRTTRTHTKDCEVTLKEMGGLVPVLPSRFQVMEVDENCDIKGFVTKNGIEFKKGRGFYELTKAETVQQYKEVIMQDRETGEMFNGSQVREKLGLQPQSEKGGVHEKLHKKDAEKFRVFVQSTSVNRKLIKGTTFLYEIPDMEDTGTVITESEAEACTAKVGVAVPHAKAEIAKEIAHAAVSALHEKEEEPAKEEKPKSSKRIMGKAEIVGRPKKKTEEAEPKAEKPEETKKEESKAEPKAKKASKKKAKAEPKVEETPAEKTEAPAETTVTEAPDKTYVDEVSFREFSDDTEILSATTSEINEVLKGKEEPTEELTGVATIGAETKEETEETPAEETPAEETPAEESKASEAETDAADECRSHCESLISNIKETYEILAELMANERTVNFARKTMQRLADTVETAKDTATEVREILNY